MMKKMVKALRFVYLPLCGLVILPFSLWFASGFISELGAESSMFPAPLWLIPAAVFLLGAVIQCWRKYFWVGISLTVLSLLLFFLPIPYSSLQL
ncbi:hypothetical protein [Bacillus sp. REN10]|uniref:hypothetical protein n=1 Tax=Bacillus sp. REN10 TaxID=2782541 RepID=UPI00193B1FA2|nr:hypothetical protein [Bacillus sp. REN10]